MKPLGITEDREGDGVRLALAGELDIGSAEQAEDALLRLEAERPAVLTIDLRGLEFMDSTGLRFLVAADRRAQEDGRQLRIVRGTPPVQRVLELTGLDSKLPLFDE